MAKLSLFSELPNQSLKVPVELSYWVIQEKQTNLFKFLLYLKFKSRYGYIFNPDFDEYAKELNVTTKTITNHFKRLIELNWIGYDKPNKKVYLRGFTFICSLYNLDPFKSVLVYPFWLTNLKGYLLTTKITDVLKRRSRIEYREYRKMYREKCLPDSKYCGSTQGFLSFLYKQHPHAHCMIPSTFLAKNLKMAVSTISAWKKLAAKTKNLKIQRNKAEFSKGSFAEHWKMKHTDNFFLRRLQIDGDVISLRLPDSFETQFTFITKRTVTE